VAATERGRLFAAYVVADGAFAIFAGMRAALPGERWWTLMLEGVAQPDRGGAVLVWLALAIVPLMHLASAWAVVGTNKAGKLMTCMQD
jgi:hypothetical protein